MVERLQTSATHCRAKSTPSLVCAKDAKIKSSMSEQNEQQFDVPRLRDVPIARFFNKTQGRRVLHVRCPFHNEKTGSLALYHDNSFHCFGCTAHGKGAIDFVMRLGSDFRQACEELQKYI